MTNIKLLDSTTINQIAAGEVVENPAAIVKELLENSVDAGATEIEVEISEGGKELISLKDNGIGLAANELELALQRYSTSKINSINDLQKLTTLGFRGEALACIAAVSHLQISSCNDQSGVGCRMLFEAGKLKKKEKINFVRGTRITVTNLFFNTPARKKFMKSVKTETARIYKLLDGLLFIYPNIRFSVINKNSRLVYPKAEDQLQRLSRLIAPEFSSNLVKVFLEEGPIKVSGYIADPSVATDRRRYQWLSVNQRLVESIGVQMAVKRGLSTMLMKNKHPVYFLNLQVPADSLDVNIHPRKTEVKFSNEALVSTMVAEAARKAISTNARQRITAVSDNSSPVPNDKIFNNQAVNNEGHYKPVKDKNLAIGKYNNYGDSFGKAVLSKPFSSQVVDTSSISDPQRLIPEPDNKSLLLYDAAPANVDDQLDVLALGQFDKYMLAIKNGNLLIFDIHAVHERILFEKIKESFARQTLASCQLLEAKLIKLAPYELYNWERHKQLWEKIGFDLRLISSRDLAIVAVPVFLQENLLHKVDVVEVIRSMLAEISDFGKMQAIDDYYHKVFASLACHSAVRGKEKISFSEMQSLLLQVDKLDIDLYCPHGRPVVQVIRTQDLDKMFKRVI